MCCPEPAWAQDATAAPAEPPDAKQTCLDAFASAQRLREGGGLVAARDQLLICARDTCPAPVSAQCITWLDQVDASLPSVVVAATGPDGSDALAVRVFDGDTLVAESLTGQALAFDPGPHTLRFELAGQPPVTQQLVLREGEKNRRVEVVFGTPPPPLPPPIAPQPLAPSPPPPAPRASSGVSPLVWIGFGVGGVGLTAGAITGILALGAADDIEEKCDQSGCTQDEIDDEAIIAHVSTATFAIGGVGIVLGVIGLFLSDDDVAVEGAHLHMSPGGLALRF